MNEHEKRIREYAACRGDGGIVERALDAILAGHRAEVEGAAAIRTEHLKSSGWMEPREAAILRQSLSSARDAALEEAAQVFDADADALRGQHAGRMAEQDAERIRALKSSPATVVSVEGVREVGNDLLLSSEDVASVEPESPAGLIRSTVTEFARRLGVDLDAGPRS